MRFRPSEICAFLSAGGRVRILVTGAGGRTSQAIVPALLRAGHTVRLLSRRPQEGGPMSGLERTEPAIGDLGSDSDVARAIGGVEAVYHIPPNMNPEEISFGKRIVQAARTAGVQHFVYHSVLRPQLRSLPHHWNKLFVEEAVIESGLSFTILQPSSYMQNLLP
ncbi:MAG: NAD-dependent epimerase/dehydratase family protein, partial [Alphaproteobacteria bacterium]|nr:NAD-dependent epimerase/dehydratase family protein [Alphaproteobacteria bacterium]